MEFAGDGRRRAGIRRKVATELRGIPRRPCAAELVDAGGVAARSIEGIPQEAGAGRHRSGSLCERAQALRRIRARADDVRLIVEDEQIPRRTILRSSGRLEHFDGAHFEERVAEHFVHRHERCRQTARAAQELAPTDAELFRGLVGQLLDARFDASLLVGLRKRHVLAVADHSRRNGCRERLCLCRRTALELLIGKPRVFFARPGKPVGCRHSLLQFFLMKWCAGGASPLTFDDVYQTNAETECRNCTLEIRVTNLANFQQHRDKRAPPSDFCQNCLGVSRVRVRTERRARRRARDGTS